MAYELLQQGVLDWCDVMPLDESELEAFQADAWTWFRTHPDDIMVTNDAW